MVLSARAVVAFGLGVVGAGWLVGPTSAQPPDAAVHKTTAQAAAKPAPTSSPAIVGTVDVQVVLEGYDKVKVMNEEFVAAAKAKQGELLKIQSEAQEEAQKLSKMTPNSVDAKKIEDKLTVFKAQIEAGREQAQRDFSLREAEMLAGLYKEIQAMVAAIAKHNGLTYVVQVSNKPITGSDPRVAYAAMAQTVVYADPQTDITKSVIAYLNQKYKKAGGVSPRPSAAAPGVGAGVGNGSAAMSPAGN